MAILIKTETEIGLELTDGYFKITNIGLDEKNKIRFTGSLWLNKEARDNNKQPLKRPYYSNYFETQDKTGNLIEQAYNYLTELTRTNEREKMLFGDAKMI